MFKQRIASVNNQIEKVVKCSYRTHYRSIQSKDLCFFLRINSREGMLMMVRIRFDKTKTSQNADNINNTWVTCNFSLTKI